MRQRRRRKRRRSVRTRLRVVASRWIIGIDHRSERRNTILAVAGAKCCTKITVTKEATQTINPCTIHKIRTTEVGMTTITIANEGAAVAQAISTIDDHLSDRPEVWNDTMMPMFTTRGVGEERVLATIAITRSESEHPVETGAVVVGSRPRLVAAVDRYREKDTNARWIRMQKLVITSIRPRRKVGAADVVVLRGSDRGAREKDARGVDVAEARAVKQAANDWEDMQETVIIMEMIAGGDDMTRGSQEMMLMSTARGDETLVVAVEVPALVRIKAVFIAEPITTVVTMTRVILPNAAAPRRRARSVVVVTTGMVDPTRKNNRAAAVTANVTDLAKARTVTQGEHLTRRQPTEMLIASIRVNETLHCRICDASSCGTLTCAGVPDPIKWHPHFVIVTSYRSNLL